MALEGHNNKAADEFILDRRGNKYQEGREDNNNTTAVVGSRILKAGAENEINAKE